MYITPLNKGPRETRRKGEEMTTCIGCGCDDHHACVDERQGRGCSWLCIDLAGGTGVCSACLDLAHRWNAGHHEPLPDFTELRVIDLLFVNGGYYYSNDILRQFDLSAAKEREWVIAERKRLAAAARTAKKAKPAVKGKK